MTKQQRLVAVGSCASVVGGLIGYFLHLRKKVVGGGPTNVIVAGRDAPITVAGGSLTVWSTAADFVCTDTIRGICTGKAYELKPAGYSTKGQQLEVFKDAHFDHRLTFFPLGTAWRFEIMQPHGVTVETNDGDTIAFHSSAGFHKETTLFRGLSLRNGRVVSKFSILPKRIPGGIDLLGEMLARC